MYSQNFNKHLARFLALLLAACVLLPASLQNSYADADTVTTFTSNHDPAAGESADTDLVVAPSAAMGLAYNAASGKGQFASASKSTVITGVPESINRRLKQSVKFTVTVSPAYGRKVRLQRYNSDTGKWVTIKTYTAANTKSASVQMSIAKKYRQKTTGKWRIYVPASQGYKSAKSSSFTVITRNIKSRSLSAGSACIYRVDGDGEGTLIYTKNSEKERAQASTTKLMTAVLVMESGKVEGITKITKNAAKTPWGTFHMIAGDTYRNHDLMYALLLPSANDAATALAEGIGGSESNFVRMMNDKAKEMGLKHTQYKNPHGLDANGHYTTAVELAKLTAYAYTFPEISEIWNTKFKTVRSIKKNKKWSLWSTNAIFGYDRNFKGGKTGTTGNAACCFTGVYVYNGKTYVTTVLGSSYGFSRWADTQKLHKYIRDYADSRY